MYTRARMHVCHTSKHTYTYIHTQTHADTHTYTPTHPHIQTHATYIDMATQSCSRITIYKIDYNKKNIQYTI